MFLTDCFVAAPPGTVTPSFTLMSIQDGGRIEFFLYELVDGKLSISRSTFNKYDADAQAHGGSGSGPVGGDASSAAAPAATAPPIAKPAAAVTASHGTTARSAGVIDNDSL